MMKPLRSLKGVGDKTEKLFQKIGVITTEDLLEYFPRNYDAYEEPAWYGSADHGVYQPLRGSGNLGGAVRFGQPCQRYPRRETDSGGLPGVRWSQRNLDL